MPATGGSQISDTLDEPMQAASVGGASPRAEALGAYQLVCLLAKGGMATVWLAIDPKTGIKVAVKRMLPRAFYDDELRRCFVDEAHLGLRLRHPNLVYTIELGEVIGPDLCEPYLVLELLRGRTLAELSKAALARGERLPIGFVLRVIADAARGLHHAHALTDGDGTPMGIVHRDVSPQNVFVCADGGVKVVDFGIAKGKGQEHASESGVIKGKVAYVAPDQLRGQAPDARIDVFALGILLHEMLTGQALFAGTDDAETLFRILRYSVPPPETLRADLSPAVGAIVLRALQRDRDRRLPSAAALVDLITDVAAVEGIALDDEQLRATVARLFPEDAVLHRERDRDAERIVAATAPIQLNARARSPQRWRMAMMAGALCLGAIAAAATGHFMRKKALAAQEIVVPVAVAEPAAPSPSSIMPAPTELPSPARPPVVAKKRRHKSPSSCAVYYSLTKGQTVVCK